MRTEDYLYNQWIYKVTYLTDDEYKIEINKAPIKNKYSRLRRSLTRGFTRYYSDLGAYMIFIKDSAKIGRDRLILHEIGHVLGKKHKWYLPFLMHPTWVFRWFKVMI